ncbi:uncharacterized protein METZ01_LOCUS67151 [marine metagenome]|uniref:Uncharacterized protein n=1 Tax=marine metagenome TaxID=408172 RepID=A0A381THP4_9ZZZZ
MKKVFPVKLLGPPRFTSPASKWFSIKNEKFFKECFFSFKVEEQLLKDTDSFCAGTKSGHSLAETGLPAAHSAL